ncbi:DUF4402 domain-containing protein [Aurantiacibacter rhizosphaerae]|uniref:DUF4402 domain-containing protein n=1 Tax=Aurantiacibacter rhizosphaerae TaxID=2691582 RepID=A0A844X9T3_9SPHN|nr:DUF4402 domain-containing protein [Aurantiacibacter rhizosphaerae]MWV26590.1 DUF4402 domain-containing protein [Aurantiacibacter rhizosphaerae]
MRLAATSAAIACLALIVPAAAQANLAEAQGRASATIIKPLSARPLQDLSFGTLTVGKSAGGEVRVSSSASQADYSGTVTPACGSLGGCQPHPALFAVTGEADRSYRVQLPGTIQARGSDSGQELAVSELEMRSQNQASQGWRGTLDAQGRDEFAIGGVLHVPAATRPDTFRAELAISVFYD